MEEKQAKTVNANEMVRKYALGTLAVGLVPFPLIDMLILSSVQLKMLHSLSKVYDVEFSDNIGKSLIAALLGGGISSRLSVSLASLGKGLPVTWATGAFSVSLFGGASTYAIGKVFIQHFESGGTFLNFDPQKVRSYYAEQFENGKQELKESIGSVTPDSFVGIKP